MWNCWSSIQIPLSQERMCGDIVIGEPWVARNMITAVQLPLAPTRRGSLVSHYVCIGSRHHNHHHHSGHHRHYHEPGSNKSELYSPWCRFSTRRAGVHPQMMNSLASSSAPSISIETLPFLWSCANSVGDSGKAPVTGRICLRSWNKLHIKGSTIFFSNRQAESKSFFVAQSEFGGAYLHRIDSCCIFCGAMHTDVCMLVEESHIQICVGSA